MPGEVVGLFDIGSTLQHGVLRGTIKTGGVDKVDNGLCDTFQQQGRICCLYRAALMFHPDNRTEMRTFLCRSHSMTCHGELLCASLRLMRQN